MTSTRLHGDRASKLLIRAWSHTQTLSTSVVLMMLGCWASSARRHSQKNIGHQLLSGFIQQECRCMWCAAEIATDIGMEMCVPEDRVMNCPHLCENNIKEFLDECRGSLGMVLAVHLELQCREAHRRRCARQSGRRHRLRHARGSPRAASAQGGHQDEQERSKEGAVRHVPLPRHAGAEDRARRSWPQMEMIRACTLAGEGRTYAPTSLQLAASSTGFCWDGR